MSIPEPEPERRATHAILVAAGSGSRLAASPQIPKQFMPLGGRMLFEHALRALVESPHVDAVVVVVPPDWIVRIRAHVDATGMGGKVRDVVAGGSTRQASVRAGLDAIGTPALVLVHDAARPFLTADLVQRSVVAAVRSGAATAAVPLADTLLRARPAGHGPTVAATTVDRTGMWAVQTPQVFERELLLHAHARARDDAFEATDDAALVLRLGRDVELVEGGWWNLKITRPEDMAQAEMLLRLRPWESRAWERT
jgi:2-C-methyl-D-erythritol 4-phosphate cytidylyltransferase